MKMVFAQVNNVCFLLIHVTHQLEQKTNQRNPNRMNTSK